MTIAELLKAEESKTLEFKRDLSSPRNLLKTLVAFGNTAGGRIIIGVADKTREPVGIDNPLDEEERLCNLIADSIGSIRQLCASFDPFERNSAILRLFSVNGLMH
ncbi:AlbA family DNA-binding domain-containing protein, partial [Desulfobulbus elongatus]|uniref:AlbA family DNA-binding domain-containing protein n=1 Tax=Desulfobulbus elongatus TaxID=53332 RepID=UPI0005569054